MKRKNSAVPPVQSKRSQAAAVAHAPEVASAEAQALAPEAEQPAADAEPASDAAQVDVFDLALYLGTQNANWDRILRETPSQDAAQLSAAIKEVQDAVVNVVKAFPADAAVQAVLDQDNARHTASIIGGVRTVILFVDTVQGGTLRLVAPHGQKSLPFYPAKGRAIIADGWTGFVLDATFRGAPRSVLIFQIQA